MRQLSSSRGSLSVTFTTELDRDQDQSLKRNIGINLKAETGLRSFVN